MANERSLRRAVVPQSLSVSATVFPTALSLYILQGRLRKGIRFPSGRTVAIWKRKIHQFGLLFLLELDIMRMKCSVYWAIHGKLTSERIASTSTLPSSIINLSIATLKRQAPCFTCLRESVFNALSAFWHQREHSSTWALSLERPGSEFSEPDATIRYQSDIERRHKRLYLSLSLSATQKSHSRTIHQVLPRLV